MLKIGIAGYGVVGKRRRQYIDKREDMRVVAVCDRSFSGEGAFDDGIRYYQTPEALLSAEKLDALFVCLTNDVAADVTIAGLKQGLHVFCEKPPGRDLSDIARVIEVERRHPELKLKYGFNHRYHDSVRDALAMLRSGALGRVLNMRGVYGKSKFISFGAHSDWRTKRDQAGGGILLDQGIHMVDLMRLFAGEFVDVKSFVDNRFWGHDIEDNAYALMRTQDGVVAMLHSTATQWRHRFSLEITFEKGALILSGILSGSKSYGAETLTVLWADPEDDSGDPKEQTTRYRKDPSWSDEIAEFVDAVLANGRIEAGSSQDAWNTMQLVYRIYCADPDWKARWRLSDIVENFDP
jgi:predicted dehydrogenase